MTKQDIISEIEKGIENANDYFIENNIKAKAYSPIDVIVETKAP